MRLIASALLIFAVGATGQRGPGAVAGGRAPGAVAGGRAPGAVAGGRAPGAVAGGRAPGAVAGGRQTVTQFQSGPALGFGMPQPGGAGFGRVLFPGTGNPATGRVSLGGSVFVAPASPLAPHPRHGGQAIVPYPVFYGYYSGFDAPAAPTYADEYASQYAAQYGPQGYPAQSAPVVIINQNFRTDPVNPVLRDYSNTPLPEPPARNEAPPAARQQTQNDQPTVFLVAMKDHSIFAGVAYWVEGDTLNYVTAQGSHNRVTLDLVDREFTKQLNDERHVEFALPVQ